MQQQLLAYMFPWGHYYFDASASSAFDPLALLHSWEHHCFSFASPVAHQLHLSAMLALLQHPLYTVCSSTSLLHVAACS